MSVQVKHRRDTAANLAAFTPAQGELVMATDVKRLYLGDGTTAGGVALANLSDVAAGAPSRTPVADANYTALTTDRNIAFTAITAARTVTLCAASAFPVGYRLTIFDESGAASATNTITINRAGSDTINGATSASISSANGVLALETNGAAKWTVIDLSASNLAAVGIGTAADPSNPLSVYGSSALFNGTNFSFTLNKSASGNTASVLFQDAFSARAQIGLIGSDNFTFKVSPNGSTYYSAITIAASSGQLQLLAGTASAAPLNLAPGVAPTAPANGDHWTTAQGVYDEVNGLVAAAPLVIGHSRVPFVIPSSGTMGNNGALSGITAVAQAYPAAYVYMPAGAIAAASAAGWYYAVFSSTIAATLYNNVYTAGTPSIPASPTAFVTTGPGAYTQTTSGVQAFAMTVPGGLIGINGGLRATIMSANNNSANTKGALFKYGGTTFFSSFPTTTLTLGLCSGFVNCGSASQQATITASSGFVGASSAAPTFATVNSAAAQTAGVTLQLANAADTVTLIAATLELLPGLQ